MDSKDKHILNKIYAHIAAVLDYCEKTECLEDFRTDKMRVEACVFNLMQIGELAKASLSDNAKNQINTIPWKQIYGMRNRIVHGYIFPEPVQRPCFARENLYCFVRDAF